MNKLTAFLKADVRGLFAKRQKSRQGVKKIYPTPLGLLLVLVLAFLLCGFVWGLQGNYFFPELQKEFNKLLGQESQPAAENNQESVYKSQFSQEQAVIEAVKTASPAVVSVIVSKEVPVYERYYDKESQSLGPGISIEYEVPKTRQKGTELKQIGSGTGFFVSSDGMIITNKHVVSDEDAKYVILTNENKKYDVKVLARDPFYDLAILQIKQTQSINEQGASEGLVFPVLPLANSDGLQTGQTVIAIGNALGEFSNTVSVGIVSGLSRRITAESQSGGFSETLENVIQTDAAINKGNSGGPLLNLNGQAVGLNVAMAESAQSIGFAIPINDAKRAINQVKKEGRIVYPFLGVVYQLVTPELQEEEEITVDYGAWIVKGDKTYAVVKGSSADKAGLKEGDIVLEVNGQRVNTINTLAKLIRQYLPGDTVALKILKGEEYMDINVTLGEKASDE